MSGIELRLFEPYSRMPDAKTDADGGAGGKMNYSHPEREEGRDLIDSGHRIMRPVKAVRLGSGVRALL